MRKFRTLIALLFALSPLALIGCNTMEGMGEDVEAAGGAVEREAGENKPY